jgi:uncharacterized protein YoxC
LTEIKDLLEENYLKMKVELNEQFKTTLQDSITQTNGELRKEMETNLMDLSEAVVLRSTLLIERMESNISERIQLVFLEMMRKLDDKTQALGEQMARIDQDVQAGNEQLKFLSEEVQDLNTKSAMIDQKLDAFHQISLESFEDLRVRAQSAATSAELKTFSEQFKFTLDENFADMVLVVGKLIDEKKINNPSL